MCLSIEQFPVFYNTCFGETYVSVALKLFLLFTTHAVKKSWQILSYVSWFHLLFFTPMLQPLTPDATNPVPHFLRPGLRLGQPGSPPSPSYSPCQIIFLRHQTDIMAYGPITSWQIEGDKVEVITDFTFWGSRITVNGDCSHEVTRHFLLGRKVMTKPRQHIKKQRYHFVDKGPYSQSYGFSSGHVWMWERDHKEGCVSHSVVCSAAPWIVAHQAPLSMGLSRQQYWKWVAIPISRRPSQPREWTQVSCIAGKFFFFFFCRQILNQLSHCS